MDQEHTAATAAEWLDEHSIAWVKTEGISIDGLVIGKHLGRHESSCRRCRSATPSPTLCSATTSAARRSWRGGTLATRGARRHPSTARSVDARGSARSSGNRQRDLRHRRSRRQTRPRLPSREVAQCHREACRSRVDREGRVRGRGDAVPRVATNSARAKKLRTTSRRCPIRRHSATCTTTPASSSSFSMSHWIDSTVSASRSRDGTMRPRPGQFELNIDPADPSPRVIASSASNRCCARSPSSRVTPSRSWPSPRLTTATGCTCTTRSARDGDPVFYAPDGHEPSGLTRSTGSVG